MKIAKRMCQSLFPGMLVFAVLVYGINCHRGPNLVTDKPFRSGGSGSCVSKSKSKSEKESPLGHQIQPAPAKPAAVGSGGAQPVGDNSSFGSRSVGAAQVRILQTGGNTITAQAAKALNEFAGRSLHRRQWGRALEALKTDYNLSPKHHGKITSTGDYLDESGKFIGNLLDYLP